MKYKYKNLYHDVYYKLLHEQFKKYKFTNENYIQLLKETENERNKQTLDNIKKNYKLEDFIKEKDVIEQGLIRANKKYSYYEVYKLNDETITKTLKEKTVKEICSKANDKDTLNYYDQLKNLIRNLQ